MATSPASGKKKTTVAGVVVAVLIGGYSLLRPAVNDAMGWNLPAIAQNDAQNDTQPASALTIEKDAGEAKSTPPASAAKRGPLAERMANAEKPPDSGPPRANPPATKPAGSAAESAAQSADESLRYGLLQEVSKDRFISPAGLMYTPGSAEGHRLEHLRRHVADQPGRAGKHGVFDGGMEGALKTIDKAYENAKAGKRTSKKTDRGRTIYTVDMGKRVGFVGGRDGNRQRKPMARRVQLVLEGNRVITAYPL